jgi:DNA-binding transcriptional ArsR family regulator
VHALPSDQLLRCLRAIGEPLRLRILEVLAHPPGPRLGPFQDDEPGLCLSDLQCRIGRAHPLVSHHVKVLHRAGLVRRIQRGRWSLLQLDVARLAQLGWHVAGLGAELGALEPTGPLGEENPEIRVSA